jgi:hypothetical protein
MCLRIPDVLPVAEVSPPHFHTAFPRSSWTMRPEGCRPVAAGRSVSGATGSASSGLTDLTSSRFVTPNSSLFRHFPGPLQAHVTCIRRLNEFDHRLESEPHVDDRSRRRSFRRPLPLFLLSSIVSCPQCQVPTSRIPMQPRQNRAGAVSVRSSPAKRKSTRRAIRSEARQQSNSREVVDRLPAGP